MNVGDGCASLDDSVCGAVALAAKPESPSCLGTCADVASLLDNADWLYTLNLADLVLELGTLAKEFETSVKAPRFADKRR